jgi:peroxiredoxin
MLNIKNILLCSLATFSLSIFSAPTAAKDSESLPANFKLRGLEGGTVQSADLEGKLLVIQFWASWCQGCGGVMGDLNSLLKNNKDVKFMPVSVDESIAEARSYFGHQRADVKPLRKIAYLDVDAKLASELSITALPAVIVVDRKGRVIQRLVGHPTKKQISEIKSRVNK